jgi:hypothetical protein
MMPPLVSSPVSEVVDVLVMVVVVVVEVMPVVVTLVDPPLVLAESSPLDPSESTTPGLLSSPQAATTKREAEKISERYETFV